MASTKITRGAQPLSRSACSASRKAVKKLRLRTSITAASLLTPPRECSASSAIDRMSCGGMLSTTYQPRSSRTLAAVDRPAPLMPVRMTRSVEPGSMPAGCRAGVPGPVAVVPTRASSAPGVDPVGPEGGGPEGSVMGLLLAA